MSTIAEQLAATKARIAADVAARKAREKAQADQYRNSWQPIPLYGIGEGMDIAYARGQMPGPSRTEARGREISGYWDTRRNRYIPANWQRPTVGNWTQSANGHTYYGGDPPDWMLAGYDSATGAIDPAHRAQQLERMRRNPFGGPNHPGSSSGGGAGANPGPGGPGPSNSPPPTPGTLPGNGTLPGAPPNAFIGTPGGNFMPTPGQGGAQPPAWFQQLQAQQAQAAALRGQS